MDMQFLDPETDEVIFEGKASSMNIRDNAILTKPLFCITYVDENSLEIIKEDDEEVKCKVIFTDEQKEHFPKEFGKNVLFINSGLFLERVKEKLSEKEIRYICGKIQYDDFSINGSERLKSCRENDYNVCFWKDKAFEYQNEFRIILTNVDSENAIEVDIGDLSEFIHVFETEQLLNGNLEMVFKKEIENKD